MIPVNDISSILGSLYLNNDDTVPAEATIRTYTYDDYVYAIDNDATYKYGVDLKENMKLHINRDTNTYNDIPHAISIDFNYNNNFANLYNYGFAITDSNNLHCYSVCFKSPVYGFIQDSFVAEYEQTFTATHNMVMMGGPNISTGEEFTMHYRCLNLNLTNHDVGVITSNAEDMRAQRVNIVKYIGEVIASSGLTDKDAFAPQFAVYGTKLYIYYVFNINSNEPGITRGYCSYLSRPYQVLKSLSAECFYKSSYPHMEDGTYYIGESIPLYKVKVTTTWDSGWIEDETRVYEGIYNANNGVFRFKDTTDNSFLLDRTGDITVDMLIQTFDFDKPMGFYGTQKDRQYIASFNVKVLHKLVNIKGEYNGPLIVSGQEVDKENVLVFALYRYRNDYLQVHNSMFEIINTTVTYSENYIQVLYSDEFESATCIIEIPVTYGFKSILAWYEGFPIEGGHSYDLNDVIIYMFPESGDWIRVPYDYEGISIDSTLMDTDNVDEHGNAWYTVTYNASTRDGEYREPIYDMFTVPVLIETLYVDYDFQVYYINSETKEETDYTKLFEESMSYDDCLIIGWNAFLNTVNKDIMRYGMYRMIAPKQCGLDNRFDCEWYVYVKDKRTLKATITKVFREEKEKDNG